MRAIIYTKFGPPENLKPAEVEKPEILNDNSVLVKVHCASVNSWDYDLLIGKGILIRLLGGLFKPRHSILGADVAGVVEAVGKNVNAFKPGDRVYGDIAEGGFGGFAEYVCVHEKLLAKIPDAISYQIAAALPQAGLLAVQGLRYKKPLAKGQHLLINGAGGGVGTLALQYAKHIGAEVTCVDKEEKFDLLKSLGADHCIDYRKTDYTRTGLTYDFILDVIARRGLSDYRRALKPGGVFAMIGGKTSLILAFLIVQPFFSLFQSKKLGIMGYRPSRKDLGELCELTANKTWKVIIDKTFPLEKTAEAFRYFEEGYFMGKILIGVEE